MKNVKYHLGWSIINSVFSLIVKILVLVAVSYLIAPDLFGIYSIGIAFVLIFTTILQLGMPTNVISNQEEDLTATALSLTFLISTSSLLIFFVISKFFENKYIQEYGFFFIFLLFLQLFINVLEASAKRNLKFKKLALNEILATLVGNGIITLYLAYLGYGIYALIYGQIVYCIIKLIYVYLIVNRPKIEFRKDNIFKLLDSSLSITIAEMSNMAMIQIQRPIVGYTLGASAAGIWSRVYQIILIQLSAIVQPMDYLILPLMSKIKKDKKYLEEVIVSILQIVSFITLIVSILTVCLAPLIIPILLGDKWLEIIIPLQIGSLIIFFRGVERVLLSISRVLGTMKYRAKIQVLQLIVVVLALVFFCKDSIIYASYAYILALFVGTMFSFYTVKSTLGIQSKLIFKSILPSFILYGLIIISYLIFNYFYGIYISLILVLFELVLALYIFLCKKDYFFTKMNVNLFNKIILKFRKG